MLKYITYELVTELTASQKKLLEKLVSASTTEFL